MHTRSSTPWRRFTNLIVCLLGVASLVCAVGCQSDPERAKHSANAETNAKLKREAILAEIKRLGNHPWAGAYYAGDGLGVNTTLVTGTTAEVSALTKRILQELCGVSQAEALDIKYEDK